MHRPDGRNDPDGRFDPRTQLGDLTFAIGTHFGDEDLCACGQMLVDRSGQTKAVVETGRTGHRGMAITQQPRQVRLSRRLAVRTGDRHYGRSKLGERPARLIDEPGRQATLERRNDRQREVNQCRHQKAGRQHGHGWIPQDETDQNQHSAYHGSGGGQPSETCGPAERGGSPGDAEAERSDGNNDSGRQTNGRVEESETRCNEPCHQEHPIGRIGCSTIATRTGLPSTTDNAPVARPATSAIRQARRPRLPQSRAPRSQSASHEGGSNGLRSFETHVVTNAFEHGQLRVGEVVHCPLCYFDGNVGIVGSPDQPNRLVDLVELHLVALIDDRDENLAHDTRGGPVVGGSVAPAGSLHPVITNPPDPSQGPNRPIRKRRAALPGAGPSEQRHTNQNQRSDLVGYEHGQMDGYSTAE